MESIEKKVTISEVLALLDAGKSRKEINEELGLNPRVAKVLWANPKLKGIKKNTYKIDVIIEDDTEEIAEESKLTDYTDEKGITADSEL